MDSKYVVLFSNRVHFEVEGLNSISTKVWASHGCLIIESYSNTAPPLGKGGIRSTLYIMLECIAVLGS